MRLPFFSFSTRLFGPEMADGVIMVVRAVRRLAKQRFAAY